MNQKQIRALLEKYWDGDTSLEEERHLKEYFFSPEIEEEHLPFQPLFRFFREEKEYMAGMLHTVNNRNNTGSPLRTLWSANQTVLRVAASVIVLIVAVIAIRLNVNDKPSADNQATIIYFDENDDPEEAYRMTKEALGFLSMKLNDGESAVSENFSKIQSIDIIKY